MSAELNEVERLEASGRARVVVDGIEPKPGVTLWGIATRQPDGRYRCHANVLGALCIIEVAIHFGVNGAQL